MNGKMYARMRRFGKQVRIESFPSREYKQKRRWLSDPDPDSPAPIGRWANRQCTLPIAPRV